MLAIAAVTSTEMEDVEKMGVWIPYHNLCCLAEKDVSETHLCPWGIERSRLIGERTKQIEIVYIHI